MNSKKIRNILEQITKPLTFTLEYDPADTEYSSFKISNVRFRLLSSMFSTIRPSDARIDVFINDKYASPADYQYMIIGRDFYVKFVKGSLPSPSTDAVIVKGDIETF